MPLDSALASSPQLVLGLSGVQNPGNVGAVIRAAEAGGSTGVVTTGMTADPYGWKALRGAMGSTFHIPVVPQVDPMTLISRARESGLGIVAATAETVPLSTSAT